MEPNTPARRLAAAIALVYVQEMSIGEALDIAIEVMTVEAATEADLVVIEAPLVPLWVNPAA
jgi:hypothetical protein